MYISKTRTRTEGGKIQDCNLLYLKGKKDKKRKEKQHEKRNYNTEYEVITTIIIKK